VNRHIPFNRVHVGEEEKAALLQALEAGALGGNGPIGDRLQSALRERLNVRHVLLTTSCSHALELAAMALELEPGDEVIMPSFTFVTSASSMVRQGARPVFVDIDERTFNIDPAKIEAAITPRTRAILPVHYAGQGCAMTEICAIAGRHNLAVIEDAAQALGASYAGQALGAIGDLGCFSFHVTKNVVCGEGGALATNDDRLAERAEILREKGTNRAKFLRGEVDKYTWVDVGSSFVPSDLLAAVALAQLGKMDAIHQRRRAVWERYQEGLRGLAGDGLISLPYVAPEARINWHIYAFRVTDVEQRDGLIEALKRRGVGATFHYVPLHTSPYAMNQWGYCPGDLPVTERVAASLVRLPIYPDLSEADQAYIISALHGVLTTHASHTS
jgi:dTDP-4-amino-4,6-dideoxygalactose transaminase